MPKIPTYVASADYQPPRGDVEAAGASARMLARFGEAVGGAISEIGEKVAQAGAERANAQAERARAEAERANGTARLLQEVRQSIEAFEAETDPEAALQRYLERHYGARHDILAGIQDGAARAEVEKDAGKLVQVQTTLLQAHVTHNLAERGRRELDDHLGFYAETAAAARHPVEQDDAIELALREIRGKTDAGFITEQDASRLEQSFHADLAERQARRAIEADPVSALARLRSDEGFGTLAPDARARLIDEAGRAVQMQEVGRRTQAAEAQRRTLVDLPAYLDSLRAGRPPDEARFSRDGFVATFGRAEGARRWTEVEEARALGAHMAAIRWATPAEMAQRATMIEADGTPSADRDLYARAVDLRKAQLWAKPADYVLENPRVAQLHDAMMAASAPLQATDPDALSPDLLSQPQAGAAPDRIAADRIATSAAYANATLAEQERLGVPPHRRQVLPEAMAKEVAARIADEDPQTGDRSLQDLADIWGDSWRVVLADLKRHGLPNQYAIAASITNPVARQSYVRALADQAREPGVLRSRAGLSAEAIDITIDVYSGGPQQLWTEADDIAESWRSKGTRMRRGRPMGDGSSIFDLLVDIGRGAIGGARDAAQETLAAIDSLGELIGANPQLSERFELPKGPETRTELGSAAQGLAQFLVGFIPLFKAIKVVPAATRFGKLAQAEGAAAAASATVFDPLEERLSNQWQELGLPQNILTDYLAAGPDESEAEGRLKNAIESLAIGPVLAFGLGLAARSLRFAKRALPDSGDR